MFIWSNLLASNVVHGYPLLLVLPLGHSFSLHVFFSFIWFDFSYISCYFLSVYSFQLKFFIPLYLFHSFIFFFRSLVWVFWFFNLVLRFCSFTIHSSLSFFCLVHLFVWPSMCLDWMTFKLILFFIFCYLTNNKPFIGCVCVQWSNWNFLLKRLVHLINN